MIQFSDKTDRYSTYCNTYPALLILMVEQSDYMLRSLNDECPAITAARFINRIIDTYININFDGTNPKNRVYIVIIGYGYKATIFASGNLSEFDDNPLRIEIVKKKISDGAGGILEIESKMPIWLNPLADGVFSNLKGAFIKAKKIVEEYFSRFNNDENYLPAPLIFNICTSLPNYAMKNADVCISETKNVVREIENLKVKDGGNVLTLNCVLDENLNNFDMNTCREGFQTEKENFFFDISSELPIERYWMFERNGLHYQNQARGVTNDLRSAMDMLMCCGPIVKGSEP